MAELEQTETPELVVVFGYKPVGEHTTIVFESLDDCLSAVRGELVSTYWEGITLVRQTMSRAEVDNLKEHEGW